MEEKTKQTLQKNELNELGDTLNDSDPEGIPQQSESETPHPQEFIELTYKGFAVKLGSCRLNAVQLSDISYSLFNLITKPEAKNEPKDKSYVG